MCSQDAAILTNKTPGPLMLSLTDHSKEKEKTSHHHPSAGRCSLIRVKSNEPGQGHNVFPPLKDLDDVLAWCSLENCGVMKQMQYQDQT